MLRDEDRANQTNDGRLGRKDADHPLPSVGWQYTFPLCNAGERDDIPYLHLRCINDNPGHDQLDDGCSSPSAIAVQGTGCIWLHEDGANRRRHHLLGRLGNMGEGVPNEVHPAVRQQSPR